MLSGQNMGHCCIVSIASERQQGKQKVLARLETWTLDHM